MKPIHIAPVVSARTKIEVSIPGDDAAVLRQLATRCETSPAILAQWAIRTMLDLDRAGELTGIPDFGGDGGILPAQDWRNQAALAPGQKPS